jgi:hypothetical protein
MKRTILIGSAAVLLLGIGAAFWLTHDAGDLPPELENTLQLRDLPANRWVKYHEKKPGTWHRQGHAGMAFDSKRGTLLIFGSDTHGEDWDNAVHEFNPRLKRWTTHYSPADPETYRADEAGRPVAGTGTLLPWAMHTYDAIEYHAGLDALVVASTPAHNPKGKSVPGITQQPTWIYSLADRRWTPFNNNGKPSPTFFGGSSAYDPLRDALIAYRGDVWELDTQAGEWRRATGGHHDLHHTMVFAQPRGAAFVFGNYTPTTTVWSYRPGAAIGEAGAWEKLEPGGDRCPPYGIVPVAYDPLQDVFVLVVDNIEPGSSPDKKSTSASTYLYDPAANTYTRLPGADLPPLGMNFMMVWDSTNEVVFLVNGSWDSAVTVWAMRPARR